MDSVGIFTAMDKKHALRPDEDIVSIYEPLRVIVSCRRNCGVHHRNGVQEFVALLERKHAGYHSICFVIKNSHKMGRQDEQSVHQSLTAYTWNLTTSTA